MSRAENTIFLVLILIFMFIYDILARALISEMCFAANLLGIPQKIWFLWAKQL